ncbi:MAG: hypothetical protein C7B45_11935 [Sulfobacillus acidophilus]|uniref:Cyclodeaminase/cyclohydrolase domain-containing protein n=1 Tax=Sulfobacillus acidophilus TaxID=53633 RepID=A0A2T2WG18_9FIRM|nr:MAG: hypothetical protein C7B45_11935 [Sulfobacillus acidophilus]
MDDIANVTVAEWLDRIARPSAVWAAGSVNAVTCAQAWSLVEMIAGLASRHANDPGLGAIADRAQLARRHLLSLAKQDALAFQKVLRDPSPQHYGQAAQIPLEVLGWARQGQDAAQQPALVSYHLAALDLKCAYQLFDAVSATSQALIADNLPHLETTERCRVLQRLRSLDLREI